MKLFVNEKEKEFEKDAVTLKDLLLQSGVEQPETVVVQLNGEFVNQGKYNEICLKEDDKVDFIYFVGGGANERHNHQNT